MYHPTKLGDAGSNPVEDARIRVVSSIGRAPGCQPGGCRFETCTPHQRNGPIMVLEWIANPSAGESWLLSSSLSRSAKDSMELLV